MEEENIKIKKISPPSLGLCAKDARGSGDTHTLTAHSLAGRGVRPLHSSLPPPTPLHLVVELAPAPAAVAAASRGRGRCLLGLGAWPGRCSSSSSSSAPLPRRRRLLQVPQPLLARPSLFLKIPMPAPTTCLEQLCNRIDRAAV